MTASDNCVDCGFKDIYANLNLSTTTPPADAYKCLVNCGVSNIEVGSLVSGVYEVLIYDPKYASVWEMPVYSTVSFLILIRVIVAWALSMSTHNFGRGLKGFRLNIIDHSGDGALPKGMHIEGASAAQVRHTRFEPGRAGLNPGRTGPLLTRPGIALYRQGASHAVCTRCSRAATSSCGRSAP